MEEATVADMVSSVPPARPNRIQTIEKFYYKAREYGEKMLSRGDEDLWMAIENLRRCNSVESATRILLRVVHQAGQNSMRRTMTDMDKHFGTSAAICPCCNNRYKRHTRDGICPEAQRSFVTKAIKAPVERGT